MNATTQELVQLQCKTVGRLHTRFPSQQIPAASLNMGHAVFLLLPPCKCDKTTF